MDGASVKKIEREGMECDFNDASRLMDARKYRSAVPLFARAAKRGDPSSQLMLGYCFYLGLGVPRSRDEALFWYRKAARAGDGAAASNIGIVFRDEGKKGLALRWFRRAVDLGLPDALLEVALLQGGEAAEGALAQATLRRLLRFKTLIPAVREEARRLAGRQ